ncbi:MAG: amidase, partial [Calditrichaeota bacterium]
MQKPNRFLIETASLLVLCVLILAFVQVSQHVSPITRQVVAAAEKLIGLHFSDAERDSLLENVRDLVKSYQQIREHPLNNAVPPALQFNPVPVGKTFDTEQRPIRWGPAPEVKMPERFEDLAYYSVRQLAELIRTRQVTSTQLTRLYLDRLKKYDPKLKCVITLTEDLALEQARRADEEIAAGHYRGPLHGIPFGAKDLLAVAGYPTTWGAMPYRDQVIDETATVVKKLEEAGAVLVAKLSLGALAWGDVWFGGKTRNPWNLEQGS